MHVEVILLEKIRNLGSLGETVKVKSGFGRNYLVPQGKAVFATTVNIAKFEQRRAELEKVEADKLHTAKEREKALAALGTITIVAKAGDEGKLFGSIGTRDIAEVITKAGVEIAKSEVHLPGGALRQVGDYEVLVDLHSDLDVLVKLSVVSER